MKTTPPCSGPQTKAILNTSNKFEQLILSIPKQPRFEQLLPLKKCLHIQVGLILLFGLLNIADGILTYLGLRYCEVAEANPILDVFSNTIGLGYSIMLIKSMVLASLLMLFLSRNTVNRCGSSLMLVAGNVLYFWVVGNNANLVLFS